MFARTHSADGAYAKVIVVVASVPYLRNMKRTKALPVNPTAIIRMYR